MTPDTDTERGVVLVNVLVVLAIAGSLMFLLISTQEASLDRVSRAADATVVEQIAYGAEASVLDALRRDLEDGPETDHFLEPWARSVIQEEVTLPTGSFSVSVTDLQAKFDINQMMGITAGTLEFMQRLLIAVDQPPEAATQISRIMDVIGPVHALDDLAVFGVAPETLNALAPFVTALPAGGAINLNAVEPELLAVMLKNRGLALQLARMRDGKGFLTYNDLQNAGVLRPQNSGLTSNTFLVEIYAENREAKLRLRSVILRRNALGVKSVEVLSRRFVHPGPEAQSSG